jgi:hypothetical protein
VGAGLPTYVRLTIGGADHACHCEARGGHAACACPICFPDLDEDGVRHDVSVKGRCGDDDPGWRTLAQPSVPTTGFVVAPAPEGVVVRVSMRQLSTQWSHAPDPRPPRALAPFPGRLES